MSKRFTATEKWGKEWFHGLKPRLKCLWLFMCDHADACGAWEPNFGLASYQVGEKVCEEDMKAFGDRVARLKNGKFLIVSFIEFQYGQLSESCPAHKPVFRAMEKNRVSIPYQYPMYPMAHRVQEEDKEEEEEVGGGSAEGGVDLIPPPPPPEPPAKKDPRCPERPEGLTIAKIFHRRPTTPWEEGEIKSFKKLMPFDMDELSLVARYYEAERKRVDSSGKEIGIHRRDMPAFLNNYRGEVDRAREWARRNPRMAAKPLSDARPAVTAETEPESFRGWLLKTYPDAADRPYGDIPEEVRREFKP